MLCIPRHGYATTRTTIENLYANTAEPFVLLYVDIASPAVVREYLEEQARERENFLLVRIKDFVSRQTARLVVLDLITTPFTVFLDNNMLLADGWLDGLISSSERENAAVVSPFIVMQGGNVHFSGSRIERLPNGQYRRYQTTEACPSAAPLASVTPERMDIDFVESHCCLMRTDAYAPHIEELFIEAMHNAHTLAMASYQMKTRHGARMIIEPDVVASILPIGFGYDIPWLFASYNRLDWFRASYEVHEKLAGRTAYSVLDNLRWHRKHLLYLLFSMTEGERLTRNDLLAAHEIPTMLNGYDTPVPPHARGQIEKTVLPWIKRNAPEYLARAKAWIAEIDRIIENIDEMEARLARPARSRRLPTLRWPGFSRRSA